MINYKEMYLKMFAATEDAINLLIATHRECEELYISQSESTAQPSIGPPSHEDLE